MTKAIDWKAQKVNGEKMGYLNPTVKAHEGILIKRNKGNAHLGI